MTNTVSSAASAPACLYAVDPAVLHPRLDALCHQVLTSSLGSTALMDTLSSGLSEVSSPLRGVPAAEGRLVERGIQMIAGLNPELVVLAENIRLPVSKAALDVVERNDPRHYVSLTLDVDSGGRRGYRLAAHEVGHAMAYTLLRTGTVYAITVGGSLNGSSQNFG